MLKKLINSVILRKFLISNEINVARTIKTRNMDIKNNIHNQNPDAFSKFRKWVPVSSSREQTGFQFSVLSYNLLSQKLLDQHSYLYHDHQRHALNWDKRLNNLMNEIHSANPEILCCQVIVIEHEMTTFILNIQCFTFLFSGSPKVSY